jgi:hypothetical protein
MTYQEAREALAKGLLVKRARWPDTTWVSPAPANAVCNDPRLRTQRLFDHNGDYTLYLPKQEDLDATDWLCRPS